MPDIIRDGMVVADDWLFVADKESPDQPVPAGPVIVPVSTWVAQRETLADRERLGVWLDSDEGPEIIADDVNRFDIIAINFPVFSDGRGYSYARQLRERYNFSGELRAIGDVLRDQLFYMARCGFNAFAVRPDRDIRDALAGLRDFSESYQAAVDQREPLFRRRNTAARPH